MEVDLTGLESDEQSDGSLPSTGLIKRKSIPGAIGVGEFTNHKVHCLSSSDESEPKTTTVSPPSGLPSDDERASTTSAYSDSDGEMKLLPSLKERILLQQSQVSTVARKAAASDRDVHVHDISSDEENTENLNVFSLEHQLNGAVASSKVATKPVSSGHPIVSHEISSDDDEWPISINGAASSLTVNTDCNECSNDNNQHTLKNRRKPAKKEKAAVPQKQKEERDVEREVRRRKKEEEMQAKKERAAAKETVKLQKKMEKEKEKLLKETIAEARRKEKPGESIKLMTVLVDCHLLELPEGAVLLPLLQTLNIRYQVQSLVAPYIVMWQREVSVSSMDDDNKIVVNTQHVDEEEVLIQIPLKIFVDLVDALKKQQSGAFPKNETLISYVRKMKELFFGKRITFLVQGFAQYLREQKSANQRKVRTTVLGSNENPKRKTKARTPSIETNVTEMDVEESLVVVQVQECCNIILVETAAEVANMVSSFTKAIAEAPYKREKQQNGFSWFAALDSRKCVRVQDSGEGLLRLWQQQIEQFNLVGSEAAQAIVAEYPSPTSLLQAYKRCTTTKECEALLQEIQVRRGAGPLARTRRVGPELSRKLYWFFTSTNPNLNLNAT